MKTYQFNGEIILSIFISFENNTVTYFVRMFTEGRNHGIILGDFDTKEKAETYVNYVVKILNLKK